MNRPSESDLPQPDLLGYLLGALDADEQRVVEAAISRDESLHDELKRLEQTVGKLDTPDMQDVRPPVGLARRTANMVATVAMESPVTTPLSKATPLSAAKPVQLSASNDIMRRKTGWSALDICVTAAVCILIAMIFLPAIANSRFQADVMACQNNLRQIGAGLQLYSDNYTGKLIPIPVSNRLGVAGIYASRLDALDLVEDTKVFFCPSNQWEGSTEGSTGISTARRIPGWDELLAANDEQLYQLRRQAGGDYAYTLGCFNDGTYRQPEITHCSNQVILADVPDSGQPGFRSLNHGGRGQNVLLGDFSTKYLLSCMAAPGDNFYQNDNGMVAPGTSLADSVLGGSAATPHVNISRIW